METKTIAHMPMTQATMLDVPTMMVTQFPCHNLNPTLPPLLAIALRVVSGTSVTVKDLKSASRRAGLVRLRQEFMLRARSETNASLPQIARFLNRDHTTVMHGIKRAQTRRNAGKVEW